MSLDEQKKVNAELIELNKALKSGDLYEYGQIIYKYDVNDIMDFLFYSVYRNSAEKRHLVKLRYCLEKKNIHIEDYREKTIDDIIRGFMIDLF